jgi:murein DD-endopeptidase MepM/ murein hydrolase activator NlpD
VSYRLVAAFVAPLVAAPCVFAQAPSPGPAPALTVTAAARSIQPGEVVVLTIAAPEAIRAVEISALGKSWPAYRADATTWRALVGIDLDTAPRTYAAVVTAGSGPSAARATYSLAVKPKAFDTRTLTVDDAFVNPPASAQGRIKEEAARLTAIWGHVSAERLWSAGFVPPVPEAPNSAFGKRSVMNGQPGSPHSGADFPSPPGEAVKAPGAGRIVLAEELYYSGNTVIIDHGLGLYSLLAHLSSIAARSGETVTAGHVVGKVGATGRVTGPHLHWSVRLGGARVDPLSLVALLGAR